MVFSERVRNYGSRGKGVSARDNHIIKGMKALHLLAALAWAGGAFSMQALGFLKLGMDDPATVKLVEYCRYIVDSWVVMPGLIGCVLTGLFYSIFTSLGFFKFACGQVILSEQHQTGSFVLFSPIVPFRDVFYRKFQIFDHFLNNHFHLY